MCDCTGGFTHALSQRRAQRRILAHHPKGVMLSGDAHSSQVPLGNAPLSPPHVQSSQETAVK
jgi:hypothetical protein